MAPDRLTFAAESPRQCLFRFLAAMIERHTISVSCEPP
jgi:hypothetical protein